MTTLPTVELSVSSRDKPVLLCNGYIFHLNKTHKNIKYWRCEVRPCAVSIQTDKNGLLKAIKGQHDTHLPDPERIELLGFKQKLKVRVMQETTPIARIYDQELAAANLSSTALALAPLSFEAQPSLARLRRGTTPLLPTSSNFDIPEKYSKTLGGKDFLFTDTLIRGKRVLTFANDLQLAILFNSSHIFIDGTFFVCPPFFDQVFTVHGIIGEHVVPCVISLLPGRSAVVYEHLFQLLDEGASQLRMKFEPTLITSDFEQGLIAAVKNHFPASRHVGCYFHHTQSIYRKIQDLGLSGVYKTDDTIRSICRQLMAIALLPRDRITAAFRSLLSQRPASLADLFGYFESYWIETVPLALWNVSQLKIRTNNHAEGWHNRFANRIDKKHPNIWHFIHVLQQEEVRFNQLVQHVKMGKKKLTSQKTLRSQENLGNLTAQFEKKSITLGDYLEGLSLLMAKYI